MQLKYRSTKTYGHSSGLSCTFRQPTADSHCRFLHGYALSVRIEFVAEQLDHRNWVIDFGALKSLKAELEQLFDHKTVIAESDPQRDWFERGKQLGVIDLVVLPAVGMEAFAELIFTRAERWLLESGQTPRCRVASVEVREHEANGAIVTREQRDASR